MSDLAEDEDEVDVESDTDEVEGTDGNGHDPSDKHERVCAISGEE